MNQSLLYALLLALIIGGSCKKPLEIVEEVGEPPLPPQGCRIVKETYWYPDAPFVNGKTETIIAEGKQNTVEQFSVTNYFYNEKGQIIGVKLGNNENYNTTYEYKTDSIIKIQSLSINGEEPIPVKTLSSLMPPAWMPANSMMLKAIQSVHSGGALRRCGKGVTLLDDQAVLA